MCLHSYIHNCSIIIYLPRKPAWEQTSFHPGDKRALNLQPTCSQSCTCTGQCYQDVACVMECHRQSLHSLETQAKGRNLLQEIVNFQNKISIRISWEESKLNKMFQCWIMFQCCTIMPRFHINSIVKTSPVHFVHVHAPVSEHCFVL